MLYSDSILVHPTIEASRRFFRQTEIGLKLKCYAISATNVTDVVPTSDF